MNPLETYLRELYEIRSTGAAVAETSYYGRPGQPAQRNRQDPQAQGPVHHQLEEPGRRSAGRRPLHPGPVPEGRRAEPLPGQIPARGVIEVKSTSDDAWLTADGEQVTRYWGKYRQVLVTNLPGFSAGGAGRRRQPGEAGSLPPGRQRSRVLERGRPPPPPATAHGERFLEYLKRVMLQAAPLAAPKDVAWFLASYARDAKARVEGVAPPGPGHACGPPWKKPWA